jgi:hypothetical protein
VRTMCGRPGAPLQQMFRTALLPITLLLYLMALLQALNCLNLRSVTVCAAAL